ncbi:hypothetical protein BGW80DRAFT_1312631 [Lactifluus volemus]|nr:hypothetical protein BGW80DRAFT_1312631 [Lactifluus volemus]
MSHYAQPADSTVLYQSIHSTPPRRPGAGVSRRNSLPLPTLSRAQTESSTISVSSMPHKAVNAADFDDREKMALVSGENRDTPTISMKPWEGWRVVVIGSWFNALLLFLPASWAVNSLLKKPHTVVFTFCILSMIPLAKLHELATRELATRWGSNMVELVIAATALRKCELRVVQSSLIGSMLSRLLLVLGMCFFAGGMRFKEQGFDATATQIHSSLLSISVGAVLMPVAYHYSLSWRTDTASTDQKAAILNMSHGVSLYCAYLVFQFWSHTYLFEEPTHKSDRLPVRLSHHQHSGSRVQERTAMSSAESSPESHAPARAHVGPHNRGCKPPLSSVSDIYLPISYGASSSLSNVSPTVGSTVKLVRDGRCTVTSLPSGEELRSATHMQLGDGTILEQCSDDEQGVASSGQKTTPLNAPVEEKPQLSWTLTLTLLIVVTILVSITAESLVESMNELSRSISKEWIALILLPMVSCIAECLTAISVSRKDRLTLSISVALLTIKQTPQQTALFVIPFMVILGWILDKPLPLLFDPFESIVLYISVHVMSYIVADGKSNWLEGAILICFYINIAVSFWFYPGSTYSSTLGRCTADFKRSGHPSPSVTH